MQTLEEFKKYYKDNFGDDETLEYLADAYLQDDYDDYPYAPYGYKKIGGKDIPIGDVSEVVDCWFTGNRLEESDLIDACTQWLINYIKSIDEGRVLKYLKEKKVNDKLNELERDFNA